MTDESCRATMAMNDGSSEDFMLAMVDGRSKERPLYGRTGMERYLQSAPLCRREQEDKRWNVDGWAQYGYLLCERM